MRRLSLCRLNFLLFDQFTAARNVVGIAAGCPNIMGEGIVHVVEVNRRAKLLILRTGKEVHATIGSQQRRGQRNQLFVGHKHKDVIKPVPAAPAPSELSYLHPGVEIMDQRLWF